MASSNIVPTGKIIGYLPGWIAPPPATELANAGYTHIIIAFGVFDTTVPGNIVSAFSEISADYIKSLQSTGLKVLLSIGGALTSVPNTTVDFAQALKLASSLQAFEDRFISSFQDLVSVYGFDGIDIDIEHGLGNPGETMNKGSTFENPVGDIRVLANIINRLHAWNPSLLITMAPQTANIAPSQAFNETWANYSALIMQTYNAISWVGIQLYNSGGMYSINLNLYAPSVNNAVVASSPDFSVAMAVDLLENWPATVNGRATGWQKYISHLKPEQIVLGYPAPDSQGNSDGAPYAPASVIRRAAQCLRTGAKGEYSCDTYVPPKIYPGFGGVFTWETDRDRDNNYAFAKDLKDCIVNNNCGTNPSPSKPKINLEVTIKNAGTADATIGSKQTLTIMN